MSLEQIRVIPAEHHIVLEIDGNYKPLPPEAAAALGRVLLSESRKALEQRVADQIADDQAIILRTGLPFGLTNNPAIQREAFKRAEDVKLPKMTIPSTSKLGAPRIINHGDSQRTPSDGKKDR